MFKIVLTDGGSKLIRFFTRSARLTHGALEVRCYSAPMFLEASSGGVDFTPASKFFKGNKIHAIVVPTKGPLSASVGIDQYMTRLISEHGDAEYDHLAATSIGIKIRLRRVWKCLGRWLRKLTRKQDAKERKLHCSELCSLPLKWAEYESFRSANTNLIDPLTLAKILWRDKENFRFEMISDGLRRELQAR
jgi:hypothetical protein